jgi:hypothetical protein
LVEFADITQSKEVALMATIPVEQPTDKLATESVEEHFRRLEATWMTEVGHHSSTSKLVNHPAFQEIIRLGQAVVPLLLRDMEDKPRLWVWALPEITGADPVPVPDRGNIAKMSEAWLRWGRANGYQW